LTKEEFTKCVGVFGFPPFPNNTYELFVEKISQIGGIDTKLEALMTVTQFSWESGGFTATASWVCSQAYDKREYWAIQENCEAIDKKGILKSFKSIYILIVLLFNYYLNIYVK